MQPAEGNSFNSYSWIVCALCSSRRRSITSTGRLLSLFEADAGRREHWTTRSRTDQFGIQAPTVCGLMGLGCLWIDTGLRWVKRGLDRRVELGCAFGLGWWGACEDCARIVMAQGYAGVGRRRRDFPSATRQWHCGFLKKSEAGRSQSLFKLRARTFGAIAAPLLCDSGKNGEVNRRSSRRAQWALWADFWQLLYQFAGEIKSLRPA